MKRADVIDNANIRAGDVVVGLESYGQATCAARPPDMLPMTHRGTRRPHDRTRGERRAAS